MLDNVNSRLGKKRKRDVDGDDSSGRNSILVRSRTRKDLQSGSAPDHESTVKTVPAHTTQTLESSRVKEIEGGEVYYFENVCCIAVRPPDFSE